MMSLKIDSCNLLLLVFCVYLKSVLTLDPSGHATDKEIRKEENIKTSTINVAPDSVDALKNNKKSDSVVGIALQKSTIGIDQLGNQGSVSNKGSSLAAIEGGGTADLTSNVQQNITLLDTDIVDDGTNHSKGSKPRKGVEQPGASVVPRKGVDRFGTISFNQSLTSVTTGPNKDASSAISDKQLPLNKTELHKNNLVGEQIKKQSTPKAPHHKKPVFVTDNRDVDDFEKYPIIQTSTTGEDYIIIGIVIVLGIWCSIFGALIFYRRAGEYWDRRHYRRMDFLVEGMYND